MNNIEFKDAVCFALGVPWYSGGKGGLLFDEFDTKAARAETLIEKPDFQLNEIREGDFIPASELDTEQKHNEVVEVFGLSGFLLRGKYKSLSLVNTIGNKIHDAFICVKQMHGAYDTVCLATKLESSSAKSKRQLTYNQIIAIGKLKRMMLGRKDVKTQLEKRGIYAGKENTIKYNPDSMIIKDCGLVIAKPKRRNKSKQAYDILKSLDYEYDLVKQKWFRKEYIQ